ncbi:MAG: RNA polymerase factor sigma-54 [Candidatus Enterenecus sp.]
MELNLTQKQTQTLSPQMVQSMEILQMSSQELLEYIDTAVLENPVLEREECGREEEGRELRRKLEWLESTDPQNRLYHRQDAEEDDDPLRNYGTAADQEETLCAHLMAQLDGLKLPPELRRAAVFLIESLNRRGWLDEELPALAAALGCPEKLMARALEAVQSLEPAGVAARNLSECLRLQLVRQEPVDRLALKIADGYLEALARGRYGLIARELKADPEEVRAACGRIRSLDPVPGAGFAGGEAPSYINPDILVITHPDHFEVAVNDGELPALRVSGYYTRLLKEENDRQVQEYLTDKVRQAKWVVRAIEQRRSTLLSCAQCIVERQGDFFRRGPGHLVPMTLADVAGQLEVHESTVSRAVRDKYLQCAVGTYPLSYFFSRGLGAAGQEEDGTSPDAARALLKELIAGEDKSRPLSDQQLCRLMEERGCRLARRTVAKYRDELNIPSTAGRRQHE